MTDATNDLSRRRLLAGAATGAALLATARLAEANTQTPVKPRDGKADPNGRFKGKVVLVTGATSGIGKATAYAFAKEGAKVFFCGRREALGKANEKEIAGFGGEAAYMRADVKREDDVKAFVDACVAKYGRLDIAFNNAGVESKPVPVGELTLEAWRDGMDTNATGVFLSMRYELPHMLKAGGGVIVNNASVSGHVGFATIAPYSASKHAVLGLTKVAALEYAAKNVRVNSVSPGCVDTPMIERALAAWKVTPEQAVADYPIKRMVQPEEIARAVMFLSSDEASCVTGMDLDVTGGWLTK